MTRDLELLWSLSRTNDQLIEVLEWALKNNQIDCAARLEPITSAFAYLLVEFGANRLGFYKKSGNEQDL